MLEGNISPNQDPFDTMSDEQSSDRVGPERIGRRTTEQDEDDSQRRHGRYYSPKRHAERRASFERKRRSFEARRQSSSGLDLSFFNVK